MFLPTHKIIVSFIAKSYPEFSKLFEELKLIAGGGIKNYYELITNSKYQVTFYYPSEKALNSGISRLKTLYDKFPEFKIIFPDIVVE